MTVIYMSVCILFFVLNMLVSGEGGLRDVDRIGDLLIRQ